MHFSLDIKLIVKLKYSKSGLLWSLCKECPLQVYSSSWYEYNSFNSSFKTDYLHGEYFSDGNDLDDFEDIRPMFMIRILLLRS